MRNLKKALSVFLCAAMMFTTLCFFPIVGTVTDADAAVVNTGNETAFYVPETIYLYPDVTSWNSAVKTPFQYYVNNTVDTENIYSAPVADANLDTEGKIYFAAKEGMSDVSLKVKFLNLDGSYMNEADYGTVEFTKEDKGTYYLFTVTGGTSPEMAASVNGCYVEWCLTYKNTLGEEKAMFNYSYIYKPYVVPYGAAARVYNEKGDVNVYGQHITWVTGVHSVNTEPKQTNTLYPYYRTLASETSTQFAFSPFLSKDNKAYAGGVEVSGSAPVANGGYNAVFSGTDKNTAYFHAGQTGASFDTSEKVRAWFYTATADNTYPAAFDYMNNTTVSTQYALSQVTPTKTGSIKIDTSRYDNLSEVPNLGVGMMVVDVDYFDALSGSTAVPTAQWYVGDATGITHAATGAYDTLDAIKAANNGVNNTFASAKNLTSPLSRGIVYAGAWSKELDKTVETKTYTVKGYYESIDRELDRQAASASVNLNVTHVDKTELRATVNRAISYFGSLGAKENWNSYYYDITYIDPDTVPQVSAWKRFQAAYINACGALGNVDTTLPSSYDEYAAELNRSLDALLSGKGLRVYFDVNHDDIGVNLWINPSTTYYLWNAENETAVIDGTFSQSVYYGITPFTPDAASYTISANVVSGTFNGNGCTVFDAVKEDGANATKADGNRYNFDFKGTTSRVFTYEEANFVNIEGINFWSWYNVDAGDSVYDNFAVQLKIEKGTQKTEYSPAGKVVETTYGTLPTPTREGYLFAGWCTDESLTTVVDASSAVSARILYAKWEKAQYNVVFEGNGATAGEMPEQTMIYDESENLNTNAYERTGYVFAGWKDSDGNSYADGAEVLNLTSEHQGKFTLYAQWTPNQYSVAFDGNTGLGGLGMANAQYDTPFNLPANYFIKTGYTFIGWSDSPDGEVLYTDKEEVSNLTSEVNGSVTLYAIWEANTFTVKFDANTASGEMADAPVVYDSEVLLPECGFTKIGYTFIGWSQTPDGEVILSDTEYDNLKTENGDEVTLYAIWSENSYTLSFDKNGGEGANITPTVYGYEEIIKLPLNVFTKTGYVLSGWSLTRDGEQVYVNGQEVNHINPDKNGTVTLYAVWTPVKYTVKFDGNSGEGSMESLDMTYDVYTVLTENTFTKEGYHFLGWSTTANGAVEYTDKLSVRNLTTTDGKEVILYAVWEINTYTVTFVYKTGAGVEVTTPVKVTHGSSVAIPSDFTRTPMKDDLYHYVFRDWSVDITNVTSDITARARYYEADIVAHNISTETKDSTCSEFGYTRYFCANCAYERFDEIEKKPHTWDEGSVAVEPGCLTQGSKVYSCTVCGDTKAEAITPAGHDFVDFPAKPATCSEEGNIAHKHCERCEQCFATDAATNAPDAEALTDEQVKIQKLPHTPGAEANCTTAQTCIICTDVIAEALGHTEKTEYITDDATCTVSGTYTEKVTCTVCGETVSETVKTGTIPHTYEETVTFPDCTEIGYSTFTCTVCGNSYTDNEVPSLGHTEGEWRETTAPGCVDNGVETNYCSVCGEGFKTRDVAATGHDAGEWKVSVPAECEEWGTESLCCTVCGEVITTRGIQPKGHGETKWEETIAPGCETAGRNSEICVDCNAELRFEVIPEAGHKPNGDVDCENDSVCTVCGTVLAEHYGHDWDNGTVTKEPTETEEGIKTYTCKNDPSHTREEAIPVRVVINLPEIPADGTYDLDANESGYAGNVNYIISVEEGMDFTVTSSDEKIVKIASDGTITVKADGEAVITVRTSDGKHEKSFAVTARTLRTVKFDVNGTVTTVKAYAGDKVTAPEVESFVDADGFTRNFKTWSVNGKETDDLTVTGDMTFVAVYTASCDYSELDRLTAIFNDLISGNYDNTAAINANKNEIAAIQAEIAVLSENRDSRDSSEQDVVEKACTALNILIAKLYSDDSATLEIRSAAEYEIGTVIAIDAYLQPLGVKAENAVWTTSDPSVGFFANGNFHAVKAGVVTVTATVGDITAVKEITVRSGVGARVVMFDTLLSNANYIVENTYIIKTTTNLFWAPDAPIHFRVITDGMFEEYYVYVDGVVVTPDASGTYTIPANTGDAVVKVEGVVKNEEGTKLSFWDMIRDFFRRIADFFRNLFNFG